MTSCEEATCIRLVVGVLASGRAVLLDHVHSGGVHCSDHCHVSICASCSHPEIPGLGISGLRDTLGVAAAHHVGVVVPNWCDSVLRVHVSLRQFHALVGTTGGNRATAAAASALVHSITLGRHTIET